MIPSQNHKHRQMGHGLRTASVIDRRARAKRPDERTAKLQM
jgi:hypothetical protein